MHWLALAMSGAVSTFDITGTMWIVTLITLFGMKSMWNHWMWGFLMGAFFLAYMGKWVRRSRVMTGAEWMVTRFGDGLDGSIAILGLYIGPMYLVGHWHTRAAVCFAVSAVALVMLYFIWYRNLPEGE